MNPASKFTREAATIYSDLWNDALPHFESGKCEIDRLVADPHDKRRGLTLRAKLSPTVAADVRAYADQILGYVPNQYVTPPENLHVTILTVVSCYADYSRAPELDDEYCEIIEECIKGVRPFRIDFSGISASRSTLLLCGFPQDGNLETLRSNLRTRLASSGLESSADLRYPLRTAHATILRLIACPDDLPGFVRFIKANKMRISGSQHVDELEFVVNDWCHKTENTQVIRTFKMAGVAPGQLLESRS